jgi:hypothetical protein
MFNFFARKIHAYHKRWNNGNYCLLSLIYDPIFLRRKPRDDDDYDGLFVVDITQRADVMGRHICITDSGRVDQSIH